MAFSLIILGAIQALATTTLVDVAGASSYSYDENTQTVKIYGGMSGSNVSGDGVSTVDTCAEVGSLASGAICNKASIYPDLPLTIRFKTDAAAEITSSTEILLQKGDDEDYNLASEEVSPSLSDNTTLYYSALWADFCDAVEDGQDECQIDGGSATFKLGFDKDNNGVDEKEFLTVEIHVAYAGGQDAVASVTSGECTNADGGICGFTTFRGDEKFYVKDFVPGSSYPTSPLTGIKFNRAIFFYDIGTPTGSSPSEEFTTELDGNEVSLSGSTVKGLENGQSYTVLMANQDEAGNIYAFVADSNPDGFVTPELVTGILTDDKCFIATAAYGSLFDAKVKDLRQFRDQFLLTNKLGRAFVKFYYEQSPPLAHWIAKHDGVRFLVRAFLWPIWAFVYLLNHLGWISIFLPLSVLIGAWMMRRGMQNAS